MNKSSIRTFAAEARKRLIADTTYRAELLGITKDGIRSPDSSAPGIERFEYAPGLFHQISGVEISQRERLVSRIREAGFEQVIEETAYIWFNRLIAVRFMEVHDYLPVRVLSSETEGKAEPDIVSQALELDFSFSPDDKACILELQQENKIDELFKMLFIKQCNILNESLPGMFQRTEDYTELLFPLSYTNPEGVIKRLLSDIAEEDFSNVEIIGWLYQYYNSELKADTFANLKKNIKISKERIPSATQLFTPEWIVRYMVENSLGRLWLEGHPNDSLKTKWKYYLDEAPQTPEVEAELSTIRAERAHLTPEDIRVIDPCMGSGHILVYAFDVLMQIYESAGYQSRDAALLILEKNLFGLDIDDRAGQLAYFAVMMKAREYNRKVLSTAVNPQLCAIQESNIISDDVLSVVANNNAKMYSDLKRLVSVFTDAKEYGSILSVPEDIDFAGIVQRLSDLGSESMYTFSDEFKRLCSVVTQGRILASKYDVVVTNPPYMGSGGMNPKLAEFVKREYPDSKSDMSAVCMEKTLSMCNTSGFMSMINIPVWMFLSSYENLRKKLLSDNTLINMVHPGRGIFGSDFGTTSFVIRKGYTSNYQGSYRRLFDKQGEVESIAEREGRFFEGRGKFISCQDNFAKIPGSPIAYWVSDKLMSCFIDKQPLSSAYEFREGIHTADNERFIRYWYEINYPLIVFNAKSYDDIDKSGKWVPYNKGGEYRKWYGNNEYLICFNAESRDEMKTYKGHVRPSQHLYFKEGGTWTLVTSKGFGMRYYPTGFLFDTGGQVAVGNDINLCLAYLNSILFTTIAKVTMPTINSSSGAIKILPNLCVQGDNITNIVNYCISISRTDWDSFETSWDFQTHPFITHKGATLKESFENWQTFAAQQFAQLKANEEELNRIFIEIYGLQDELTPEVEEKDVTIRRADLVRDVKSFISYAVGCMFGRYSLDTSGLVFAGGEFDASKYVKFPADEDGIIPITDRDYFPDDIVGRFIEFLKVVFGAETLEENLEFVAEALGTKGRTAREIIRNYFLKGFYEDHVRMYQKRPIYWLFDSGKENGFKALIYLYILYPRLPCRLTHTNQRPQSQTRICTR